MTENEVLIKTPEEAIETIKSNMPTSGYQMLRESLDMAIIALKEIQQYREIGTVEECRESKEKQIPKTPKFIHMTGEYNARFKCPVCKQSFIYDCTDTEPFFCKKCGQALRMEAEDD